MPETNTPSQRFYQLTQEGYQQLVALCDLCEAEKAAIEVHDLESFKAALIDKQKQLEQIGHNIEQRKQILTAAGFSNDDAGLEQFLASLPEAQSQVIRKSWERLSQQLETSSELNKRNELIVKRGQKNVTQLLALMQGHSAKTTLYDQKGSAGNYSAQNRLGKA